MHKRTCVWPQRAIARKVGRREAQKCAKECNKKKRRKEQKHNGHIGLVSKIIHTISIYAIIIIIIIVCLCSYSYVHMLTCLCLCDSTQLHFLHFVASGANISSECFYYIFHFFFYFCSLFRTAYHREQLTNVWWNKRLSENCVLCMA